MPQLPDNWPFWLIATINVIYWFRKPIGSFVPEAIKEVFRYQTSRQIDREEFEQRLKETQLSAELTDQLRKSWREEQLMELLQEQFVFTQRLVLAVMKHHHYDFEPEDQIVVVQQWRRPRKDSQSDGGDKTD